ncbi:MAG: AAA family ATPase [Verrucomicrobiaceae bacterium]|nr:AAA family ATPase [Verrucomicrobiaceae bacterium]
MSLTYDQERQAVEHLHTARAAIHAEVSKVVVGQQDIIDHLIITLLSGGHGLITGAPGLAKTLLVKTLAQVFDLSFQRVQFTPDLMPSDITGTEILEEDANGRRSLVFNRGPIFANMILADEINRTPPKTQAALLEAMQEHQVTVAGQTYVLPEPFFVLATQNPIEMEGTYPLPEAQLDRFMLNVVIEYLNEADEVAVVQRTTAGGSAKVEPKFTGEQLELFQKAVRGVPCAEDIVRYAVRLSARSRPGQPTAADFVKDWVSWGAGTRASQCLVLAAKARALLHGRDLVKFEDIRALALPVMRHRILINYRAEAEGITVEKVINRLVETTPEE